jgi:hypothetical protein
MMASRIPRRRAERVAQKLPTKAQIQAFARDRGLSFAQAKVYEGMVLRRSAFALDASDGVYYNVSAGKIQRTWRLNERTATGLINSGLVVRRRAGEITYYELAEEITP